MLTNTEWVCLGILAFYGISALWWIVHFFLYSHCINKRDQEKIKGLGKNRAQWELPVEYKGSSRVDAVKCRKFKDKRRRERDGFGKGGDSVQRYLCEFHEYRG